MDALHHSLDDLGLVIRLSVYKCFSFILEKVNPRVYCFLEKRLNINELK